MGAITEINWADSTLNPWIGCTKVSDGCTNCYAAVSTPVRVGGIKWGPGEARKRTSESNWRQPLKWNREPFYQCKCGWRGAESALLPPSGAYYTLRIGEKRCPTCGAYDQRKPTRRRVFCASLSDVFDNEVPDLWRDEVFALMSLTPNLDWMVLTKRIGIAGRYINDPATPVRVGHMVQVIRAGRHAELHAPERIEPIADWPGYFITSKGRVLSDRTNAGARGEERHVVKPQAGKSGHQRVMLRVKGTDTRELVHRLVLTAFDRAPRAGEQACHLDGDPSNNALWNLRWGTQSDNWDDSKRHGTRRRYSKLTPEQAAAIKARLAAGEKAKALASEFQISDTQVRNIGQGAQWAPDDAIEWPPRAMWLGATVVNQAEAERDIPKLLRVPARIRFLSVEPMLGRFNFDFLWLRPDLSAFYRNGKIDSHVHDLSGISRGIDWVICGGESGPNARPVHPDWVRSLRDQCVAAGVPFLFKQWGEWTEEMPAHPETADILSMQGKYELIDGTHMTRVGKKLAGNVLDGRQHLEFPE